MLRRLLFLSLLVGLILAAPRPAAAQSCLTFVGVSPCRLVIAQPWRGVSFGAPRFVPEPRDAAIAFRSRWTPPSDSPWQWRPMHAAHTFFIHPPRK